jgi:16S rRNA (guanine966-N2)-methyltransferase
VKPKNKLPRSHTGSGTVRIIGGSFRGRKIPVLNVNGLRPTPDRVRETLFNWLMPHMADAKCLDAFSGSGALSIESVSRGAAQVIALENSFEAVGALKKTGALLNINNLMVIHADALTWLNRAADTVFDIVFIDPPFHQGLASTCCALLETHHWLNTEALIYVEYERSGSIDVPDSWRLHRQQQAGEVTYVLYIRTP